MFSNFSKLTKNSLDFPVTFLKFLDWENFSRFSSADGKPGILTHGYGSLVSANDYDSEILRLDLYDDTTVLNFFP